MTQIPVKRRHVAIITFLQFLLTQLSSMIAVPSLAESSHRMGPNDLAVIVNDADPLSIEIAGYYQARRNIPGANMIHVRFSPQSSVMSQAEFEAIKAKVDQETPRRVQAFALTWSTPYRVDCMSITSAFAVGFDKSYCATGCMPTKSTPYFNSGSWAPYRHYHLRPTMSLAGKNFEEVKKLIDRGVQADHSNPPGTGYLVDTSDSQRNVRSQIFDALIHQFGNTARLQHIHADYIENKPDVLFYFTGLATVPKISSNTFVPGAIADHLTSTGGQLTDSSQMSILRWLEAGATGSYGAVVEPCNFPNKFPHPGIVISRYLSGESLIEAYWKSVEMPGQGIFIGEPLASPYANAQPARIDGDDISLQPGDMTE